MRPKPASCQVSIVFIAFMLYFYFKKREKLVCLWKQNDILDLCNKFTKTFPSCDISERQFYYNVFIFLLVDGTCKIFVERAMIVIALFLTTGLKPEWLQGGGKCVSFHYPFLIFFQLQTYRRAKLTLPKKLPWTYFSKTTLNL